MRVIRRLARETFGLGFTSVFCGTLFLGPVAMALWSPDSVETEVFESAEREVVFLLGPPPPPEAEEVDEILAAEHVEPEPEPVAEAPREPKPELDDEEETSPWGDQADTVEVSEVVQPTVVTVERPGPTRAERLAASRARRDALRREARARDLDARDEERKARATASRGQACEEPVDGLSASSRTTYDVEQHLVDHHLGNLKQAQRLAVLGWAKDDDGKIYGFKLRRVRKCSVLHQAGLRSGDVVTSINGKPITNVGQAWAAYRRLKRKKTLLVDVKRRGSQQVFRYNVG